MKLKVAAVFTLFLLSGIVVYYSLYKENWQSKIQLMDNPKGLKINISESDLKTKIVADMKSLSGDKILEEKRTRKISTLVKRIRNITDYSEILESSYLLPTEQFLKRVQELEDTYFIINEWKSQHGEPLSEFERHNPKVIFTLSLISDWEIFEIIGKDFNELNLRTKDIYVINKFATSQDFNLLNQQGRLNSKEVTLEKLNMIYDNSSPVMETSDGESHGGPTQTPREIPEQTKGDNEN
jgi:hypothetical protein